MGHTRREVLLGAIAFVWGSLILPGCASLKEHIGKAGQILARWQVDSRRWWVKRSAEREAQRKRERESGERPGVETPRPHLVCGRQESSRGWLGPQIIPLALNEEGEVAFIVENLGNAASWSCFVEMYEGPWGAYDVPYSDFRRTDRQIVSVLPGEAREVSLKWKRTRQSFGHIIIRCYDPVLDPALPVYSQYYRKNSGIGWMQWEA